jgi:ferredoxin, 2Fe-2S
LCAHSGASSFSAKSLFHVPPVTHTLSRRLASVPSRTKVLLMATIRVIYENGGPERIIEFDPAKAPFQHDGQPGSVLDVLLGHGIHLEHACGGNCACTTCHLIVRQGFDQLSEASEQEEDLLDRAPGLTPTSRLGCQAVIEDADAEVVVIIPRYTINQVSEAREG